MSPACSSRAAPGCRQKGKMSRKLEAEQAGKGRGHRRVCGSQCPLVTAKSRLSKQSGKGHSVWVTSHLWQSYFCWKRENYRSCLTGLLWGLNKIENPDGSFQCPYFPETVIHIRHWQFVSPNSLTYFALNKLFFKKRIYLKRKFYIAIINGKPVPLTINRGCVKIKRTPIIIKFDLAPVACRRLWGLLFLLQRRLACVPEV